MSRSTRTRSSRPLFCANILIGTTLCLLLALTAIPAFAVNCGDYLTSDMTLTADLGPCPNIGLGVDGISTAITIRLNGHSILGSGNGTGILLGSTNPGVTIKGPGSISNFQTGVQMGGAAVNVAISLMIISGNQTGIGVTNSPGPVQIQNNVILGGALGQNGIEYGNTSAVHIHDNTISGFSNAGILIDSETSSMVMDNVVTLNQIGIYSDDPAFSGCNQVGSNLVTLNQKNGIQFGFGGNSPRQRRKPTPNCVIEGNTVSWNGGSGVSVAQGTYGVQVQNNLALGNGINGIAVFGGNGGDIPVTGNQALGNAADDLFWDGNGAGSCWSNNVFMTSLPANLPPCS